MAEEQEGKGEGLTSAEKKKLEDALLDTSKGDDGATAPGLKGKIQKILSNKKLLMIFGGGALVLLIAVGAGIYFMVSGKEEIVPVEEDQADEKIKEETSVVEIEKVNIYKLEPFFLPILEGDKETGKFISLSANLLMSNSELNKDLDKVLPLIRKNIYSILRRKRPTDFTVQRAKTEERIKKEILTASNAILLSGTGTVTDVFFLNFMVK